MVASGELLDSTPAHPQRITPSSATPCTHRTLCAHCTRGTSCTFRTWCNLRPFIPIDVITPRRADVDLLRPRDLLLRVEEHLFPLRDPAAGARNREQHREHGDREAHRLVDEAGIEVDVRVELARDEILVLERDALQLQRDVEQRIAPGHLEHFVGGLLDDLRARVVRLVDAMAESHQPPFAALDALDEAGNVLHAADLVEHAQHGFVGAARSEEHTSELQSQSNLVCRLLLEKKKKQIIYICL